MSDNFCDSSMCLVAGDDVVIDVDVFDSCEDDASPVDLTSIQDVTYTLSKSNGCDTVVTKTLGDGITILPYDEDANPDTNKLTISLDSADTEELCGVYSHRCYVINSDNHKITIFKSDSVSIAD